MFRVASHRLKVCTPSFRSFQSSTVRQAPLATKFNLPDPASPNEYWSTTGKFAPKLTKIVATIGPTSEQLPALQEVVKNGMRIMRLNFSHATTEEVELRIGNLKKCRVRTKYTYIYIYIYILMMFICYCYYCCCCCC